MGKKENMITVIIVELGKKPYVKEIENTLESLQHEVGGYIQTIYPFEEPVAIFGLFQVRPPVPALEAGG